MSVLELHVDIDSDVHPELHAVLAAMGRSLARAERLRQLAAAGLIWEHLRAQARPSPNLTAGAPTPGEGPGAASHAGTAATETAADAGRRAGAAGPRSRPRGDVPVLWDVIEPSSLAGTAAAIASPDDAPTPLQTPGDDAAALPPTASPPLPPQAIEVAHDDASAAERLAPALYRSGARPRLLRMMEKGLFRHGADG